MNFILASSSIYRKQQLMQLGLDFECSSPNIDEDKYKSSNAKQTAKILSQKKAQVVANKYKNHIIIAGDQTAICDNTLLNKPLNFDNAVKQLHLLQNNCVKFYSGLTVLNSATNKMLTKIIQTNVFFKPLTDEQIKSYLNKEPAFDCVGAAKIESLGISLVKKVSSPDPSALIGLPLIALCQMLEQHGVNILND